MKTTAMLCDIAIMTASQAWDNYMMAAMAAQQFSDMGYRAKADRWDRAARASLDRHFHAIEQRIIREAAR